MIKADGSRKWVDNSPMKSEEPKLSGVAPNAGLRAANSRQAFGKIRLAREVPAGHSYTVSNDTETVARRRPGPREKPFIVQCADFRCMAYRDSRGQWRDYFNGDEISGEVTILSEG